MPPSDIQQPVFKPDIGFKAKPALFEEQVTIVHCTYHFPAAFGSVPIRIWPTTFLVQEDGKRKKLLQAFNISSFPVWKMVKTGHRFTLIFEGLDRSCKIFDLLEDITEPGAFRFSNIPRNNTDVYWLNIDDD